MSAGGWRVVYDCNIYVQALINIGGPAGRCVEKALAGDVELFITPFILDEIRESYQKIPAKYGVTREQTAKLAIGVAAIATNIINVPAVFTYDRDPDDAHYVNVALAADAKLVVSRDRDLLDLMDEKRQEALDFKSRFPGLRILEPVQFLQEIEFRKD